MLKSSVSSRHDAIDADQREPADEEGEPARGGRDGPVAVLVRGSRGERRSRRGSRLGRRLRRAGRRRVRRRAGAGGPAQSGVSAHAADCIMARRRRGSGRLAANWESYGERRGQDGAAHGASEHRERRRHGPRHLPALVLADRPRGCPRVRAHRLGRHPGDRGGHRLRRAVGRPQRVPLDVRHGPRRGRHDAQPRLLRRRHRPHRGRRPEGRGGPPPHGRPARTADRAPGPRQHPDRGADRDRPPAVPAARLRAHGALRRRRAGDRDRGARRLGRPQALGEPDGTARAPRHRHGAHPDDARRGALLLARALRLVRPPLGPAAPGRRLHHHRRRPGRRARGDAGARADRRPAARRKAQARKRRRPRSAGPQAADR